MMRLFGDIFNLMLLCMTIGFAALPVIIGIGYIVYKIIQRKRRKKWMA